MFERAMIGLHVSLAATLAMLALAAIALGANLELLATRNGNGAWWFIGIWLVLSTAIASIPRVMIMWLTGLRACAIALGIVTVAGIWQHSPLAIEMAIALSVLVMIMLFVSHQLHARPSKPMRHAIIVSPIIKQRVDWARRLSWWVLVLCMAEAFRLGQIGSGDVAKGIGNVGMLLSFFVMLPFLSVSTWFPRLAGMGWLLSATLLAAMAFHSSNLSSAVGSVLTASCAVMLLRAKAADADKSELPQ